MVAAGKSRLSSHKPQSAAFSAVAVCCPTNLVGGPASMLTEQAGPEFAPSPKGRSTPGGEPGSERSVGPLSAGALDPEAPGGWTDTGLSGHLQEALQVPTVLGITGSGASQTTKTTPQASSSVLTLCGDKTPTSSTKMTTSTAEQKSPHLALEFPLKNQNSHTGCPTWFADGPSFS